jgi:hypothetical protein
MDTEGGDLAMPNTTYSAAFLYAPVVFFDLTNDLATSGYRYSVDVYISDLDSSRIDWVCTIDQQLYLCDARSHTHTHTHTVFLVVVAAQHGLSEERLMP